MSAMARFGFFGMLSTFVLGSCLPKFPDRTQDSSQSGESSEGLSESEIREKIKNSKKLMTCSHFKTQNVSGSSPFNTLSKSIQVFKFNATGDNLELFLWPVHEASLKELGHLWTVKAKSCSKFKREAETTSPQRFSKLYLSDSATSKPVNKASVSGFLQFSTMLDASKAPDFQTSLHSLSFTEKKGQDQAGFSIYLENCLLDPSNKSLLGDWFSKSCE